MGVAIVEGRAFTDADRPDTPRVAIVNETLARRFWPGESAIGKIFRTRGGDGPPFEIVGVSADHKVRTLSELPTPFLQIPRSQRPSPYAAIIARTRGDAGALLRDMRRELLALEPNIVFVENQTMETQVDATLFPMRASAWLVSGVGLVAMLLAAIGLYGVIAYSVARRTQGDRDPGRARRPPGRRRRAGDAAGPAGRGGRTGCGLRCDCGRGDSRRADARRRRSTASASSDPVSWVAAAAHPARRLGARQPHPCLARLPRRSVRSPAHRIEFVRTSRRRFATVYRTRMMSDLRVGLRLLWRDKAFTLTAGADAGALHRRQHRAVFRRPQRPAAAAAGARVGSDCPDGQRLSGRRRRGGGRELRRARLLRPPARDRRLRGAGALQRRATRASTRTARRCGSA